MSRSRSRNKGARRAPGCSACHDRFVGSSSVFRGARKAQFSIEIVLLMGFFVIIFTGVLLIVTQRSAEVGKEQAVNAAQDIVNIMTREIRYAYIAGEGYERTFTIPRTLVGANYSLHVINFTSAAASGLDASGPQAAMLLINASTLTTPVMLSLPYKVSIQYVDKDTASLTHNSFKVTLDVPRWTQPG